MKISLTHRQKITENEADLEASLTHKQNKNADCEIYERPSKVMRLIAIVLVLAGRNQNGENRKV